MNCRTLLETEWVVEKALLLLLPKELVVMASTCSPQTSMSSINKRKWSPSHWTAPEVVAKWLLTTNPIIRPLKLINNRCKSFCSNKWRPTTQVEEPRKTIRNLSRSKWITILPVPSANRFKDIKVKVRAKERQLILKIFMQVANRAHKN